MKVKFKRLCPDAILPAYSRPGDAGLDLTAVQARDTDMYYEVRFGIAVEIPEGYFGLIVPRSSITNMNMILKNSVGVIDSNYRGELSARFKKVKFEDGTQDDLYVPGQRCAQLIILPYPTIEVEDAEELSDTNRGVEGYGSSGQKKF